MSKQSYEDFQFERQSSYDSSYEGVSQNNHSFALRGQKLVVRKGPHLWQRLTLALVSFILWLGLLLCVVLAWKYTWNFDLGYTHIVLVAAAFLMTLYFIFVNLFFNRNTHI